MNYQECLLATYFDLESWVFALVGLIVSLLLLRFGKVFSPPSALLSVCCWQFLGLFCTMS